MSLVARDAGYVYGAGSAFASRALEGISLEVDRGGLVLVLGRTGTGKSTLLRLLAGLLDPSEGSALADGAAPSAPEARGRVGIVFQAPESQLFADTVADDVAFGPRNLGRSEDDVRADSHAALSAVGLDPAAFGGRSPFTLSGGEARRAAIAGVLAMRPGYLLFDEPTAGLDADGRRAVREAVARARESAGIVVVSHDAEEWLAEADSVLVLDAGRASFSGAAAEIVARPEAFSTAGLVAPGVLEAWRLAVAAGIDAGPPTLDPRSLAEGIASARKAER